MRRYEARRTASGINIPCAANIQARAVWRHKPPVHDKTPAVRCYFGFYYFIFPRKAKQRLRQFLPFSHGKSKPEKEPRLAATGRVRRIQQVMRDFSLRHRGRFCVGQFHFYAVDYIAQR